MLGQWQGFPLWSSAEIEAQLRIILQGLDLMFDRARATLDRTPYVSRCWLNTFSKDAFWPHGFQVIPSFKDIWRYGKDSSASYFTLCSTQRGNTRKYITYV
jgi:hypothetical protein